MSRLRKPKGILQSYNDQLAVLVDTQRTIMDVLQMDRDLLQSQVISQHQHEEQLRLLQEKVNLLKEQIMTRGRGKE